MQLITYLFKHLITYTKKSVSNLYYVGKQALLGHHKRDIVVIQVEQACSGLKSTRNQFQDTLQQFKNIVNTETTLEHRYALLQRQFAFCQAKSEGVSSRIAIIETVSTALFVEWEEELKQYSSHILRAKSRQQLKITRQQYNRLIRAMRKAEGKMSPVLSAFKDQLLFLKHNLNAQAIATLQYEFIEIGIDISRLIEVMEITINEAGQFVSTLVEQKALPSA